MISHYDLCKLTAERFLKEHYIALFEYQSFVSGEFPDVLCFGRKQTKLFEIKVDKQDFKKDDFKQCRSKIKIKYYPSFRNVPGKDVLKSIDWRSFGMEEFIQESPHLGRTRYYVCPEGLIFPNEIKNGWGLYWYNGKFRKKKDSKLFRNNIHEEIQIISHAFRKYACGDGDNILVNKYKK